MILFLLSSLNSFIERTKKLSISWRLNIELEIQLNKFGWVKLINSDSITSTLFEFTLNTVNGEL